MASVMSHCAGMRASIASGSESAGPSSPQSLQSQLTGCPCRQAYYFTEYRGMGFLVSDIVKINGIYRGFTRQGWQGHAS